MNWTQTPNIHFQPCPFCGGQKIEIKKYCKTGLQIKCRTCMIEKKQRVLRYSLGWLESTMIDDWNTRVGAIAGDEQCSCQPSHNGAYLTEQKCQLCIEKERGDDTEDGKEIPF